MPKASIIIRNVLPEDKEKIMPFCVNTFDWGDYIDDVFDTWVEDKESHFILAELDGAPVGILHIRVMKHGNSWMEGLRVAKDRRGQGIATMLTNAAIEILRRSGCTTTRIAIESNNMPSMSLAGKIGFREESDWLFYHSRKPLTKHHTSSIWASKGNADKLWNYLDGSDLFNRIGRAYEFNWALYPLEKDEFNDAITTKEIAFSKISREMAISIAQVDPFNPHDLLVCVLTGGILDTKDLLHFLLSEAVKVGIKKVYVSSPNNPEIVAGIKSAGFKASHTSTIIFVKNI